jgi:hypothetical protein
MAGAAIKSMIEESANVQLFGHIKWIFDGSPESDRAVPIDRVTSAELVDRLIEIEGGPWAEWKGGKPLTQNGLARLLSKFEILSGTIRIGNDTAKGYYRTAFEDAFARYLPPQGVTTSQVNNNGHCDGLQSVTPENLVTLSKASQSNNHGHCDGVTVSNGNGASSQHKCDHCQQYGGTIEVAYDGAEAWLHRECMDPWRTAYDDLDIRNQPFYRPKP